MSASSSRQGPPSSPSAVSLAHVNSLRSHRSQRRPPPPITSVITSPPWARDEPPSPKEQTHSNDPRAPIDYPSDVASLQSNPSDPGSRWWTFALPRPREQSSDLIPSSSRDRTVFKDLSMSWLPSPSMIREGASFASKEKERDPQLGEFCSDELPASSLCVPPPSAASFTIAHNATPGWDTPWTARPHAQGPVRARRASSYGFSEANETADGNIKGWRGHGKRVRSFILTNTHVPLFFRFTNITFTGAALGMAIRIRNLESKNSAMGAVGSSPTVVIIFAPLTLVHVMIAIYLEYFGRPLGLWRTSAKLAHTLSEVLFICAWSAALSLCFDNYFTSLIPCASPSSTLWYNQLPRPTSGLPNFEGSVGDHLCESQLSLICLVGVGLIAYCTNLIISLYRIFEKVKYHPAASLRTS